jgi:hypothetical protein
MWDNKKCKADLARFSEIVAKIILTYCKYVQKTRGHVLYAKKIDLRILEGGREVGR